MRRRVASRESGARNTHIHGKLLIFDVRLSKSTRNAAFATSIIISHYIVKSQALLRDSSTAAFTSLYTSSTGRLASIIFAWGNVAAVSTNPWRTRWCNSTGIRSNRVEPLCRQPFAAPCQPRPASRVR